MIDDGITPVEEADVSGLWLRLQELESGELSAEQREDLMRELEQSPSARQAYFEYFQQSAVFKMEGAKMHEQGLLPVGDLSLRSRRLFQRSILAAAALVAVLAVVATLIAVKQPEPGILSAAVAADTRWVVDGAVQVSGEAEVVVVEGSTVRVLSGTVRLELESGARLVLQGPARVSFPDLQRPVLKSGWLWIDTGESEGAFEVEARGLLIRDIGTRFGVRVAERSPVEVHLIEGKVEVRAKEGKKVLSNLDTVGQAVAIRLNRAPLELELAPDPFPGLAELIKAAPTYRTTVLSQAPVGYWKLEEREGLEFSNEVQNGGAAGTGLDVSLGERGVTPKDGFAGFEEGNVAVRLNGHDEKSVLYGLGGGRGVSRREGSVSFWIRRSPELNGREVLWLAGETYSGRAAPEQSIIFTELTESGHVRFFIENGKFDVALSSSRSIADDGWHHVAASWGPSSVDLFIDGKLAARDVDSRVLKEGTFTGRYVRFGKPSSDLNAEGAGVFTGWVDEVGLWSRPLSDAEVSQQFQSARGQ